MKNMVIKFNKATNLRRKRKYKLSARKSYVIMYLPNDEIGILHERWVDEGKPGKITRVWDFEYAKDRYIENFDGTLTYMSIGDHRGWIL